MSACPACGRPMAPREAVVCGGCWRLVPQRDQQQLTRMYRENPDRAECWRSKADKVVRNLRAKLGRALGGQATKGTSHSQAITALPFSGSLLGRRNHAMIVDDGNFITPKAKPPNE